ncbi:hypothetical protein PRUB_a0081 [Pseudoalteromonas rubra]|uniref:Phage tail protein n=1 Tax=Pseudoalteromonas rubra TaxID=43658 RepID=A0A8T0C4P8_9GAMM|nr:phage tail protein [Pseudoalteromonas rubra]KAF7785716.1 hypothetical protein PRUB_a0081 [Pseudoalteromonas rubra]
MADNQAAIKDTYPLSAFRYMVKVGDDEMNCSEVSGLNIEYDDFEYKEATKEGVKSYQLLGQVKPPSITLKRGLFKAKSEMYKWLSEIHTSDFTKKDIVISLLDNENSSVMTWSVLGAFPTKFEGPSLKADDNSAAFQSLELKAASISVS